VKEQTQNQQDSQSRSFAAASSMDSDSDSTGRRNQTYEAVWFPHPSAHSCEGTPDSSVEQNRANTHEPSGAIMGRNMHYASRLFGSLHAASSESDGEDESDEEQVSK
jgi:hypothetical protein